MRRICQVQRSEPLALSRDRDIIVSKGPYPKASLLVSETLQL